jgi:hypothetical protein
VNRTRVRVPRYGQLSFTSQIDDELAPVFVIDKSRDRTGRLRLGERTDRSRAAIAHSAPARGPCRRGCLLTTALAIGSAEAEAVCHDATGEHYH